MGESCRPGVGGGSGVIGWKADPATATLLCFHVIVFLLRNLQEEERGGEGGREGGMVGESGRVGKRCEHGESTPGTPSGLLKSTKG